MSWQVKWLLTAIAALLIAGIATTTWWFLRETSLPTEPGYYVVDLGNTCELWAVNASGRINIPVTRCDFGVPGTDAPSISAVSEACGVFSFHQDVTLASINAFRCVGCGYESRPRPDVCPLNRQDLIWTRFTP
jgi:hypothetical protein